MLDKLFHLFSCLLNLFPSTSSIILLFMFRLLNQMCLLWCCQDLFFTKRHLLTLRKREEEQRRREAVQRVPVDKQKGPVMRTEQRADSLVVIENLTTRDAAVETKRSPNAERPKNKAERLKGPMPVVDLMTERLLLVNL